MHNDDRWRFLQAEEIAPAPVDEVPVELWAIRK